MAEAEDESPKPKKRGFLGINDLLRDKEALLALASGFGAASKGGDFSQGAMQGLANYGAIESARFQREAQKLQQAQHAKQQSFLERYGDTLSEDERTLYQADPETFMKERIKSSMKGSEKASAKKQTYDELIAMGIAPNEAMTMAYGKSGMRIKTNPDGTFEIIQGVGADSLSPGVPPKLSEQEAKYGLFGTQAIDAHKRLTEMEKSFNPSSPGNAAYTVINETPLIGRFGEFIPAQEMKAYQTELNRVIDGWARAMTGAAMPDSERIFYRGMIGGRPGDGPEVIARKARNRGFMANSLQQSAGRGYETLERVREQMVDPYTGEPVSAPKGEGGEPAEPGAKSIEDMTDEELRAILESQ